MEEEDRNFLIIVLCIVIGVITLVSILTVNQAIKIFRNKTKQKKPTPPKKANFPIILSLISFLTISC